MPFYCNLREGAPSTMKPSLSLFALLVVLFAAPLTNASAQEPTQRMIRSYVPQDQLVSFQSSMPFDQFMATLNPIFQRITGKSLIDPEGRTAPIGVTIVAQHFFDALALVLQRNNLTYRENDRYFVVSQPLSQDEVILQQSRNTVGQPQPETAGASAVVSLGTREIQINAILFDLNVTRARELGMDWDIGGGGRAADLITLSSKGFFDLFGDAVSGPSEIPFTTFSQLFRALENDGVGNTLANPQITVTSGVQGSIQIGSDIPIQTRDFSGNTITQFVQTGTIVKVTPTLYAEAVGDEEGAALVDFVHLDVIVEKSGGRPTSSGVPIIDRNRSETKVLLLDGEQTIIAGLYSTEESVTRRGIPVLKDLPVWFLGLRYLFGYEQRITSQRELLIVLQANLVDSLSERSLRPTMDDGELIRRRREQIERNLERTGEPTSVVVRY